MFGHGAQICARAPTKGYIGTKSAQGLSRIEIARPLQLQGLMALQIQTVRTRTMNMALIVKSLRMYPDYRGVKLKSGIERG